MTVYLDYLRDILQNGVRKDDRTGTGTRSVFGRQLRFDLQRGFPLLTTKEVWFKGVAVELLWFLSGSTNIRPLVRRGVSIWTDWPLADYRAATGKEISQGEFEHRITQDDAFARKWGALGPIYSKQWRDFGGTDQIARLVKSLQEKPQSRRHLVSAWNPAELAEMRLPPCHYAFQCWMSPERRLSLMWQQRSVDSFLGLPFNIASYALLTHLLAAQTGCEVGELIFSGGDCHIYQNHVEQVQQQLAREPHPLPTLHLETERDSIFDYEYEDFAVKGYEPHPAIPAPIAV